MTRRELLLLASIAPLTRAQVFRSDVRVVNIYVTVRDRKGELVRSLTREDFEVREDGRKQFEDLVGGGHPAYGGRSLHEMSHGESPPAYEPI